MAMVRKFRSKSVSNLNHLGAAFIRECLAYSPYDGGLYWSPFRPDAHFVTRNGKAMYFTVSVNRKASRQMSIGYKSVTVRYAHTEYFMYAHHVVWYIFGGTIPKGLVLDHDNRRKDDNRIENLFLTDPSGNQRNKDSYGGVPRVLGVHKERDKWRAKIEVKGVITRLGLFLTYDEAVAARRAAELQYPRLKISITDYLKGEGHDYVNDNDSRV